MPVILGSQRIAPFVEGDALSLVGACVCLLCVHLYVVDDLDPLFTCVPFCCSL